MDSEIFKEPRLAFDYQVPFGMRNMMNPSPMNLRLRSGKFWSGCSERDLPNRQKRAFWDRFSREKKAKDFHRGDS